EIEIGAPDQIRAVGVAHRLQTLSLELGEDKTVNGRLGPFMVLYVRQFRLNGLFEGPEFPLLGPDRVLSLRRSRRSGIAPGSSRFDPGSQIIDFGIAQPTLWWHLQLGMSLPHGLDQETTIGISRHYCRSGFSPGHQSFTGLHLQSAHSR